MRVPRITVRSVVLASRAEGALDGVLPAYPPLTLADVRDALALCEAHRAEIDWHILANLDEA